MLLERQNSGAAADGLPDLAARRATTFDGTLIGRRAAIHGPPI
jgi:hypothetical protein